MEEPLILDRYRPLAHIGSGGHGSVVLAFDTRMARRVAIKRLPLTQTHAGVTTPRVGLAEARTAALLNHPNIVTVHEWDTDSDEAFIVMEDLDGDSLAGLLDLTRESLSADEVAAILEAVAPALSYAHANGVLHLDLKPANIVVTRTGTVKVADFGISALTDSGGRASATAGTIGYMPPEQLRGEALDERTDLWALAALLYELLTNANPFDSDSAEGSLFKIEVADVPAPSEFESSVPPQVDDVLLAALAPEPDERYDSVEEFARALRPYLGDAEAGRASLRVLLFDTEDEEFDDEYAALGLWDRLAEHSRAFLRVSMAAAAAWLMWGGLSPLGLGLAPTLAACALAAAAGALAPALGMALGLIAFSVGLGAALGWLPAVGFGLIAAAYWLGRGRFGSGDSLAPVAAPLLGVVAFASGVPLVLGFVFPPLTAAFSAGASALALVAASALSGGTAPFTSVWWSFITDPTGAPGAASFWGRVLDPGVGVVVLCWMGAAALTSLICRRATRVAGLLGVACGAAVLAAGYASWAWLSGDELTLLHYGPPLAIGTTVALMVAALGAPTRPEEE